MLGLSVGAAIWGALFGILAGAVCGSVYGLLRGDVSLGLDGALLGGSTVGLAGLAFGVCLALREPRNDQREPAAVEEDLPRAKAG
jgi:hypothetical protein